MIYYAASDLPDEWRSPTGTRGANARLGTFRQLTGHNMPDISSFTYWLGSNSSGDFNAATHEVAGTGWSITEYIKGIIWQLRKLLSDYEEHKLQQRDLESQNTAHAVSTLESFTQVRGILNHLRTELQDVHAKILGDSATTLLLSRENEELKAGQIHLQRQLDAQVAEQHVLATFATDSVEEDFADRLATVETAAVRLQEAAARDQHEHGRVVTRVEQESARTLQVILRVNELESGSLAALWRLTRLEREFHDEPEPTD
jgi:hypothetical protein